MPMIKKPALLFASFAMVWIGSAPAFAQAFKPFTEVKNVCPSCEPERFDRLELEDGRSVEAWIVRDNPGFVVIERHGELRVVPKAEISQTTLSPKRDANERQRIAQLHMDQVLLANGHVLSGRVTQTDGTYNVSSPNGFNYTAQREVISKVVLKGVEKKP
jgi:hypothetical protein